MDEVRIRRRNAGGAHNHGDLSPVVGGMKQNMREYIVHCARPGFTLGVLVVDLFGKCRRGKFCKIFGPDLVEIFQLGLALRDAEFWPNRVSLRLLFDAVKPQQFRRKNVRQKFQRARGNGLRRAITYSRQNFGVSPGIVGELAA